MTNDDTIKVLYFPSGEPARLVDIEHTVAKLQEMVGGNFEVLQGFGWYCLRNDEGRTKGLPVNQAGTALAHDLGWAGVQMYGSLLFLGEMPKDGETQTVDVPPEIIDVALGLGVLAPNDLLSEIREIFNDIAPHISSLHEIPDNVWEQLRKLGLLMMTTSAKAGPRTPKEMTDRTTQAIAEALLMFLFIGREHQARGYHPPVTRTVSEAVPAWVDELIKRGL